jgi:hypothetical protein
MALQKKFSCKVTKKTHIKIDLLKLLPSLYTTLLTNCPGLTIMTLQVLSGLQFFAQQRRDLLNHFAAGAAQ